MNTTTHKNTDSNFRQTIMITDSNVLKNNQNVKINNEIEAIGSDNDWFNDSI